GPEKSDIRGLYRAARADQRATPQRDSAARLGGRVPARRGALRLARKGRLRNGALRLLLERVQGRARAAARGLVRGAVALPGFIGALGGFSGALARLTRGRRCERHPCAPGFREPNGDRLFRRARAVLALADVMDLLAHE